MISPKATRRAVFSLVITALLIATAANYAHAQSAGCRIDIVRSDAVGFEMDVELLDLDIQPEEQDGIERHRISIQGESVAAAPGMPELPHISRLLVVPPTARLELDWTGSEPVTISSTPPLLVSHDVSAGGQSVLTATDYSTPSGYWPNNVVELGNPAIMRGVRVVRITVNPVQVEAATGDIKVWKRVRISVNYCAGKAINPVVNADRARPSKSAAQMIRSLALNPNAVRRDQDRRGAYMYIIPDYDGVAEAIEPLVDWRKRQGYPTEVVVINANNDNTDVRDAIEEAYFEWTIPPEFVCLVGDADRVHSQFMIATEDVGRAYMWETDYRYACLEGDDLLPEIAIGRISARSVSELERVVNTKIYPYEAQPYMEETEWYRRAALMANDARTGYSSIYLQRWLRKMLLEVGFAEVDTFYFIHHDQGPGHDFIVNNFEAGMTLFCYRGWGQFNGDWSVGDASDELDNGMMLPFLLLPTCNTGDFSDHIQFPYAYTEDFLWARRGGAIGSVGSSGFTHTNYNNVFSGGTLNSFFRDNIWEFGWALNRGKLELYRHFGLFNDVDDPQVNSLKMWEAHCYQNNLIGDPATQLWTSVPREVYVNHPEVISVGENNLTVRTDDVQNEESVPGMTVSLMHDGEHIRIGETDNNGRALFVFQPGELPLGVLDITVTKHNYIPYMAQINVESANLFLGISSFIIDDDNAGRSRGNGDGNPNPGETIELRTYIANFGESRPVGRIDLELTDVLGDVEITDGDESLNQAPEMGDSSLVTFVVELGNECWNNRRTVLNLTAENGGDESWESPIEFFMATPDIECVDFSFDPETFNVGDEVWLDVTFHNEGLVASPNMRAELISLQSEVVVYDPFDDIDPIEIEEGDTLATARFRVYAYDQAIPGTFVRMLTAFESEAGFRDSTYFSFTVDAAGEGTPFGPDAHGYGCFDDTDTTWDMAPVYEWIEIDPDSGGDGVDTEINDVGNELDWSVLVDLPFGFRYYGEDFDEITICSNGWFAFGNESKLADFQNRRIPPALGPRAQVCVFWDDLINYRDNDRNRIGGIYHWFDEENHLFIIEWTQMRRYIGVDEHDNIRPGGLNIFQAILYDPQHYQTYTGDGDIVFQYHTCNNDPAIDPGEYDTPYGTVGIVNLNGTDGMEYTYWNEYPAGAAVLEEGRAIKFTTALIIVTGAVRGTVVEAATGQPIANAEIRGDPTSFGLANQDGEFHFDVLVGDDYTFTAWAPGYNEQTVEGIDIEEGCTVNLEFSLTNPEFGLSQESIELELAPDYATVASFTISNTGNGPLTFCSYYDYPGGEEEERWRRLLDFDVTAVTEDTRINGVGFLADAIWVTGSNSRQNPNLFYQFNREGELVDTINQPTESDYGFRGVAIVGDLIYGGEGQWIIGVDAEGAAHDSIPGPLQIQRALAYDPETETFWLANSIDPILNIDRDGNVLDEFVNENELEIQGLGFLADDPDGYPLYIASQNKPDPDAQVPEALISKMDPSTGDLKTEVVLEGELDDRVGGMEIVPTYDATKWVMLAVMTNPEGDRVSVYDLGPSTNWVSYSPRAATVETSEDIEIGMSFNAHGLEEDEYGLVIRFEHNAAGLETNFPVRLKVDENAGIDQVEDMPLEFGLQQNYPNPFNALTSISFTLPEDSQVELYLFDISGRQVATVVDKRMKAGAHQAVFEAGELPSGIYLVRLEANARTAFIKMALIK